MINKTINPDIITLTEISIFFQKQFKVLYDWGLCPLV